MMFGRGHQSTQVLRTGGALFRRLSLRRNVVHPRNRHRGGFSLLEVMLSLSLAVILLGAIFAAMDQSWKLTASGREDMQRVQVARAVLRKIALDVRSVYYVKPPADDLTSKNNPNSNSTEEDASTETTTETEETTSARSLGIMGTVNRLELHLTRARRDLNFASNVDGETVETRTSDLRIVVYSLGGGTSGTSGSSTGLFRTEADRLSALFAESKGQTVENAAPKQALAPEVTGLEFRYFDGQNWFVQWDSDSAGHPPRAIEVSIQLAPPVHSGGTYQKITASASTSQFRTVIPIPVSDPLPDEFVP